VNVKEYIRSGVIESYVLGIATEAERQEFEQICDAYPEVAQARDQFERSLEAELMQGAIQPPVSVKEKVLLEIKPFVSESGYTGETVETPVRRMNPWMWVAAASLLLLGVVSYLAFTANQRYNEQLAKQLGTERQLQEALAKVRQGENPFQGIKVVSVPGTEMAPQAQTFIFWDTTRTKDVYMMVKNLPLTTTDKQYQLWALLDGKPIDLGVFDVEAQQKPLVFRMKNVQNAQAFAITLEERGGKPAPEGKMYAVGEL
jgi:anti-sigma-K factor RskA